MSGAAKAYRGMGMEGGIARWYDRATRKSMEDFRVLATRTRLSPRLAAKCWKSPRDQGFFR